MKNKLIKQNGITLIALVITIIVLLILAGVSISMISSQDGILNKATNAKKITEEKAIEDRVKLATQAALIDGEGTINLEDKTGSAKGSLYGALKKEFGETDDIVTKYNGDGEIVITSDNILYINQTGKVSDTPETNLVEGVDYEMDTREAPFLGFKLLNTTKKKIIIPEGIEQIAYKGCMDKTNIEEVILPKSLKNIYTEAFSGCTNLKKINLENVELFGDGSLANCTKITSLNLKKCKSIDSFAFEGMTGLTSVIIPEGTETLGTSSSVFNGCTNLTSITIPSSASLGYGCFIPTSNPTDTVNVYYKGTEASFVEKTGGTNPETNWLIAVYSKSGNLSDKLVFHFNDGTTMSLGELSEKYSSTT